MERSKWEAQNAVVNSAADVYVYAEKASPSPLPAPARNQRVASQQRVSSAQRPKSYSITSSAITGEGSYDPLTGTGNRVFVPSTSSLYHAGSGGANIGANTTCIYDRGVNTGMPMWNQADGRFVGCDWYPAGSADDIAAAEGNAQRCSTAHALVNVGTNGGIIPPCLP